MHRIDIRTPLVGNDASWETWELPDEGAKIPDDLALAFHQANPENVFINAPHEDAAPCVLCDELYILVDHDF